MWLEGTGTADRRFLTADERGSIDAVTDDAGNVLHVNKYSDYGNPASGNVGRFQYTGQMWLSQAGLYHYKARAYNPAFGRFMQADPIGYAGGINLYAYANNDPINNVDPLGTNIVVIGHRPKKDDSGEPIDPIYDIEPPTAIETLIVYGERFKRDLESPADFHFDDFDISDLLQAEMGQEIEKEIRCSQLRQAVGRLGEAMERTSGKLFTISVLSGLGTLAAGGAGEISLGADTGVTIKLGQISAISGMASVTTGGLGAAMNSYAAGNDDALIRYERIKLAELYTGGTLRVGGLEKYAEIASAAAGKAAELALAAKEAGCGE